MEDVPIFRHKQRPPLATSDELQDELLIRTTGSNSGKYASLTPSPDEETLEEKVKCLSSFNVQFELTVFFFSFFNLV